MELVATVNAMRRMKDAEKKAHEAVKERDETIKKLEDALAQIKMLKGILPICSYCKKIRNDKGYWEQLEMYIATTQKLNSATARVLHVQRRPLKKLKSL